MVSHGGFDLQFFKMFSDVEHLFLCLLAIYVSLEKYRLSPLPIP